MAVRLPTWNTNPWCYFDMQIQVTYATQTCVNPNGAANQDDSDVSSAESKVAKISMIVCAMIALFLL